jgi:predicted nuclease with TOPRIM domain
MVSKTVVVLSLVCVVLAVGLVGTFVMLNQKDAELQIKTNQIAELETEKLSLASQVSPLQTQVSALQDNITALETDKSTLETQVSVLQTNVSILQNDVADLEDEKSDLESQILPLQTQVSGLQDEVDSLEDDKDLLEQQVSVLQTNVGTLETTVGIFQTQVTSLENEKASLELQVTALTTEVADLEDEVIISYNSGYDAGYTQGTDDLIQTGYYSMDPTYDEAISFIELDETDENTYTPDYVCYDFTADLIDNAAQLGYRCGFVYIEFSNSAHAIACFNTTDAGLIFVEPQNDELVDIAVGQLYLGHIIVKMGIIW